MASTRPGRDLTEAHKLAQIDLSLNAVAEAVGLAGLLDPFRLDDTAADWLGLQLKSIEDHFDASAALAGAYLDAYRAVEGEPGPVINPVFDAEQVVASAYSQVVARTKRDSGAMPPRDALLRAFDAWHGTVQRHVLRGGRDLVSASARAHPASAGFRRVTDGNPCAFCAMLASRGPVYGSAGAAGGVSGRAGRPRRDAKRPLGERYHDFCGCTVEEVFGEWEPTAREQGFIDLYERSHRPGMSLGQTLAAMRGNGRGTINDSAKEAL